MFRILLALILVPFLVSSAHSEEFSVGLLTELSGSMSANGAACKDGFEVARETVTNKEAVGNHALRFVYGDTQGAAASAISEFKKMIDFEKIDAVISTRSQISMPLNPISQQKKVPLLGIVGHAEFVAQNSYAFRFWPTVKLEGPVLAKTILDRGHKSIAAITLEDEWTLSLLKHTVEPYVKNGGTVLLSERVLEGDTDLATLVSRVKAKNPDAIFINVNLNHSGALIKKIREQGLTQEIFTNFWAANDDSIAVAGKEAIEGVIYIGLDLSQPKFLEAMQKIRGHQSVTAVTYTCYSALAAVAKVLEGHSGGSDFSIADGLRSLKTFDVLDGQLKMEDREVTYKLKQMTVRDGRKAEL